MSNMQDREKAFENKYALDQELMFKIEARASKLFALWLAGKLEMEEAETAEFATFVINANLESPGFNDVKRAVAPKISAANLDISENEINDRLMECMEEARKQITEGQ